MDPGLTRNLHIISFNVPYPPDYGGIIDVFNKIRCLSASGISIHLHSFTYNRPAHQELEKYCKSVRYYKRLTGIIHHLSTLPYIVYSRRNKQLLKNLLADNYPILFEGLHTTYYLKSPLLRSRMKLLRMHNIEHNYYFKLGISAGGVTARLFHLLESIKLRFYESNLRYADYILSISKLEDDYFKNKYGCSVLVPPFHSHVHPKNLEGKGEYILLHGNLAVAENVKAIRYVLPIIRKTCDFPIILAGKNPGKELLQMEYNFPNTRIISSPGLEEMHSLIQHAHLIILYTDQSTGIKLKLIDSLFLGRFVIANSKMAGGSGMEEMCEIADTPEVLSQKISEALESSFDEKMVKARQIFLSTLSNTSNAEVVNQLLIKG